MSFKDLSKQDIGQILQYVYDDTYQALRTRAEAVISGIQEVQIEHTDDSVRLGDGTSFLTSTANGPKLGLDVNLINPSGSLTVTANQGIPNTLSNSWPVTLTDGTFTNTFTANGLKVDGSAVTQPISAATLPLPLGAATSALQTAGNASLTSIDSKIPPKGPNTAVNSMPVTIATDQPPIPVVFTASQPNGLTTISSSITAVASSTPTTLITYTVPPTKTFYAEAISVGGSNHGQYDLQINAVLKDRRRTSFTEFNSSFVFMHGGGALKLNAGDTISIIVEHFRPSLGDFEAMLLGQLF